MDHLVVSGLTTLEVSRIDYSKPHTVPCLAACSGLQQLRLYMYFNEVDADGQHLHTLEELVGLTALTKLVMGEVDGDDGENDLPVPPVVWELTWLQHLDLSDWLLLEGLPHGISNLQRLTHLNLSNSDVVELPSQLSTWLPKLAVLDVGRTDVEVLPPLPQLVHLHAGSADISGMCGVDQATRMTELHVLWCGQPSLDAVSLMTSLEVLHLNLLDTCTLGSAPALPRLRIVNMSSEGGNLVLLAGQLIGSGRHLTYLSLGDISKQQEQGLKQLGVLPVLQELRLRAEEGFSLLSADTWLQQQPHLTSLVLSGCDAGMLGQLPLQLLRLELCSSIDYSCAGLADTVRPLTNLRHLFLLSHDKEPQPLPAWLSSLQRLEVVSFNDKCTSECEVLQQLPLLRHWWCAYSLACVPACMRDSVVRLLRACPHLCWSGT
jgi:Leucine-rich repeat (LRR) protein